MKKILSILTISTFFTSFSQSVVSCNSSNKIDLTKLDLYNINGGLQHKTQGSLDKNRDVLVDAQMLYTRVEATIAQNFNAFFSNNTNVKKISAANFSTLPLDKSKKQFSIQIFNGPITSAKPIQDIAGLQKLGSLDESIDANYLNVKLSTNNPNVLNSNVNLKAYLSKFVYNNKMINKGKDIGIFTNDQKTYQTKNISSWNDLLDLRGIGAIPAKTASIDKTLTSKDVVNYICSKTTNVNNTKVNQAIFQSFANVYNKRMAKKIFTNANAKLTPNYVKTFNDYIQFGTEGLDLNKAVELFAINSPTSTSATFVPTKTSTLKDLSTFAGKYIIAKVRADSSWVLLANLNIICNTDVLASPYFYCLLGQVSQ